MSSFACRKILPAIALALAAVPLAAAPLVTEEEAKLPEAKSIATRAVTRAPGITLVSPAGGAATAPFHLRIAFEPRGGAKVDPATVKLTYLKTPLVDLTARVRAGIDANGIEQREVQMPPGEHRMRVSLTDSEGRNSTTVILLTVAR